jgi:hypothetical protein
MSNDTALRLKTRDAINAGTLPKRSPDKLWGGSATGARCAVCGVKTTPGAVELELEFTRDSEMGRTTTYFVHPHCFSIFSRELGRMVAGTQQVAEPADDTVAENDSESPAEE